MTGDTHKRVLEILSRAASLFRERDALERQIRAIDRQLQVERQEWQRAQRLYGADVHAFRRAAESATRNRPAASPD